MLQVKNSHFKGFNMIQQFFGKTTSFSENPTQPITDQTIVAFNAIRILLADIMNSECVFKCL